MEENHGNISVDATEILSNQGISTEGPVSDVRDTGKPVRQNSCSICGAFGHNKKFHKKKCKICQRSGHVSYRCPNKLTKKHPTALHSKSTDELCFPEKEKRGTKQDLTQAEIDITARVLLCCHNEKKWKEIQSVKDISQRASMYTGISKATCAAIYKQLKEGHWPEKGPSKRGKYDRETHNLKKKKTSSPNAKERKNIRTKKPKSKIATIVSETAGEKSVSSYDNVVSLPLVHPLNDVTVSTSLVSTIPMQLTTIPSQQNYTFVTDSNNLQVGSTILSNLLGNHCMPTVCNETLYQGMVTQNVVGNLQHQQQQQNHQQQIEQVQQHQVDGYFIQQVPA